MTTFTISLPTDRLDQLKAVAERFQVAPEDLVRASIEDLLTRPDEVFLKVLEHVLDKNAELYQRLA